MKSIKNYMNIVRKIKLNTLGCYNFKSIKENELFNFIKNNLFNLKIIELSVYYKDTVFYFDKKKIK